MTINHCYTELWPDGGASSATLRNGDYIGYDETFDAGDQVILATMLLDSKGAARNFNFKRHVSEGKTLFVGEGNLSFALALGAVVPKSIGSFVISTFEPARQLSPIASRNAGRLIRAGAKVLHGIDATRLNEQWPAPRQVATVVS